MTEKNPEKGYVAILGWSPNAIDAIDRFDRRYVIVAPPWAEEYAKANDIPFIAWDFDRLNERSHEIGRASCRERVLSVRVDLGGRRIIKKKKKKKKKSERKQNIITETKKTKKT